MCSFVAVYTLTIKIPIISCEVFMHDPYSITGLINLYRTILICFNDFLGKRWDNVSSIFKVCISLLLFQQLVIAMQNSASLNYSIKDDGPVIFDYNHIHIGSKRFCRTNLIISNSSTVFQIAYAFDSDRLQVCKTV